MRRIPVYVSRTFFFFSLFAYTGCPTTYQTRQFFNNFTTIEDIATRFEQEYVRCVRNERNVSVVRLVVVAISSLVVKLLKNWRVW